MRPQDEIRNNAEGQSLALARSVAATFRRLGWRTREGAAHAGGIADVAASREWERKKRETRVHVVIRTGNAPRVLFSEAVREAEDAIASYARGDLGQTQPSPRPPAAPPARAHAAAFRADAAFQRVIDEEFASIDAVLGELRAYDVDVLRDDVEAGAKEQETLAALTRRRALVHALVVTDASLWTYGERLAKQPWVRLHRARVVGGDERWIDVVSTPAFEKYAAAVTRYYSVKA